MYPVTSRNLSVLTVLLVLTMCQASNLIKIFVLKVLTKS